MSVGVAEAPEVEVIKVEGGVVVVMSVEISEETESEVETMEDSSPLEVGV